MAPGLFLCVLGSLGVLCAAREADAQVGRPKADVTSVVERPAHAGDRARLALKVSLPDGLHTQSDKPRDPTLIPTVLTIEAPAGVTVDEIVFPKPTDLKQAGQDQPLAVFEQVFAIGAQVSLASSVPVADVVIPATLRYQACDANLCYPASTTKFQWTVKVVPTTTATEGQADPVFATIAFGTGARPAGSDGSRGSDGLGGSGSDRSGSGASGSGALASGGSASGGSASGGSASGGSASGGSASGGSASGGSDRSGGSGDATRLLDNFNLLGTTGGYQGTGEFLRFIKNAENGVKERGMFEGRGPLAILLIVLVGGLALNLTPCVLPMIPINLAIIGAGAQAASRRRGFLLGSAYGGAMALVYGVLGLVVILTAGTFGTINSSPWFNLGIAVLFIVLGLAMFDVLLIDFSKYSSGVGTGSSRGTFGLAFSMGAVAALLAGACVAPVVIQVVLFSSNLYATGTKIALALPFFLGLGMAIPWPIAGAGLAALPKPGMWMVRVKQAFGVFILATAAYYGYEAYSIFSNRWVDPKAVASSVEEQLKAGWSSSLEEGLAAAQREQKPVLIDMWATWCKNCLTMDKTTLANSEVQSALNGYVKVKYQAEDPDEQPAKGVMQRFDAVGLPAYVILRPATR